MTAKIFDMGKYLAKKRETGEYLDPPDVTPDVREALSVLAGAEQFRSKIMKAWSDAVKEQLDREIMREILSEHQRPE